MVRRNSGVCVMVSEKLLYSRKFLVLMLIILYLAMIYISLNFNYEGIAIGTGIAALVLAYLAYYAHVHRSAGEVVALSTFTALALILGVLTGSIIAGFENVGVLMYAVTLTTATLLLLLGISKLYRI